MLEDSPLDADLITNYLCEDGFECLTTRVETREDFESALHAGSFDVILSDYSLPSFDGISALELAQALRPQYPFLFVSGHLGEELAIETLKKGATDYVLKDKLERLVPSVKRALREAQARKERQRIETSLRVLSEASLVLSSLDYATTLSQVARLAVPHFADLCIVDVITDDFIERVAVAHADAQSEALAQKLLQYAPKSNTSHPTVQVLQTGQSCLLEEVPVELLKSVAQDAQHLSVLNQLRTRSGMIVPLLVDGQAMGAMTFVSTSGEYQYTDLDISLAEDLARRCSLAVENARLHRKTVEAVRARDEFLAVLSHELRSPLTSILGWIHLLQEEKMDSETHKRGLQVIERNAKAQVQLIQDLLEVSRIITGRLRLDLTPTDLAHTVELALSAILPTAEAKGVHVTFNNEVSDSQVMGDAPRLQQILWNLLSNAVKFTPRNGNIEVALRNEGNHICLSVTDSGEGIESDFLPFVFDRFRQADSSSTRKHGGLGLGLAIVRHLTEMHGGSVHVHSDGEGKGAAFTVRLPVLNVSAYNASHPETDQSQIAEGSESDSIQSQIKSLNGLRILLVEDEEDVREISSTILRRYGAQVTPVTSAQAAMAALQLNIPDILVSDIAMPGEDGYGLIRHIRQWEKENKVHIPAIALTAYAGEQDRQRALAAGYQRHLSKPIEPATLVLTVAELAEEKASTTQSVAT